MKLKWVVNSIVIMLLCGVALLSLARRDTAVAAEGGRDKIEGLVLDQFATNGSVDFIVRFTEQADLSPAYTMDWNARGEFVYNTLRDTAAKSQVNAKAILDARGLTYQTFFAGNDLYVWGGNQVATDELAILNELAALPEVYFIRATRTYYIDPVVEVKPLVNISWAGDFIANRVLTTVDNSTDAITDWGITDTKADQFWTTFDVKGDGIVVASIDTGVQWNHPALVNQFKCPSDPTNPACWKDPSNICGAGGACDNNGHGTHTMGTMVADNDPVLTYIAGMAPNAKWIACKGCESTGCSDLALNTCADWILAPAGGETWYQAKVQAWVAAGIFPAFSAGNSGPNCSTLGSPGDYQEAFGSAAHDSGRNIASFSSRGPSTFGHDPYTKPNLSAPGVSIWSSVPTNSWAQYSGTSMASPHTAGAVALLWSCNPSLVGQVDKTFQLLQNNTDGAPIGNCGVPPNGKGNYTYGYGYLNVLSAGVSACSAATTGTLEGHVFDKGDSPIEGATVSTAIHSVITDPTGYYSMTLMVGTYDVTASKLGYSSQTTNGVVIADGATTKQDFNLTFLGAWTQIALPTGCPDWSRFDGEYYAGTGLVYFLGGRSGTETIGDIYSFNPITEVCADTSVNMPTPISNYTIVPLNDGSANLLCTFGGRDSSGNMTLAVQCYNPITNTVLAKANLPDDFNGFLPGGIAVVNNNAYIFGGFRSNSTPYNHAYTYRYDPVADAYNILIKGDLKIGRGYIEVAVVDGLIYAFGGDTYDGTNLVAQTIAEKMDPALGIWNDAEVADLPTASGEGRAYGFDTSSPYELAGKIILTGGGQFPSDTNAVISYDVASNTYNDSFPDLNIGRRDQAGFFVPGNPGAMWVFGGRSGSDSPPYAPPEYFKIIPREVYLPILYK
jgi:subtilisin family serine protease